MTTTGLRAPHALRLAFDRSVGGATAAFLSGLARGEIWGSRGADGRVAVPPRDGDELVRVSDAGEVRAWSWVATPEPDQPLDRPFAYALIRLDGADTSLLHVVEVEAEEALAPGLRVRADWLDDRTGSVRDIRSFVPGDAGPPLAPGRAPDELHVDSDRVMPYTFEPGIALSGFFRALADGRIEGGRCPSCEQVHVPPHARCPVCGAAPDVSEVGDTGVIESVTVVHLPVAGLDVELPFAWARIRLDGADVSFPHVIDDAVLDDLHVGQRVEAVWHPPGDRPQSWEAIRHFRPVDR